MKEIYKVCNEELVFKISVYQLNSPLLAVKAFRKTGEPYVTVSYNPHLEYSAPCNTFLVDIYACKEIKEILKVLGAKPCMMDGNPVVGFDCVSISRRVCFVFEYEIKIDRNIVFVPHIVLEATDLTVVSISYYWVIVKKDVQ